MKLFTSEKRKKAAEAEILTVKVFRFIYRDFITLKKLLPRNLSCSFVQFALNFYTVCLTLFFVCVSLFSENLRTGIVTANLLNVRAKPGTSYTVIAKLKRGTKITILGEDNKWLKIRAPETSKAWIPAKFVNPDNTISSDTPVYAGPSVSYSIYGWLRTGEKIKTISKTKSTSQMPDYDWYRIKVPKKAFGWVHKDYVYILPSEIQPKIKKVKHEINVKNNTPGTARDECYRFFTPQGIAREYMLSLLVSPSSAWMDSFQILNPLPFDETIPKKIVTLEGVLLPLEDDAVYVDTAICIPLNENDYFPVAYLHGNKYFLGAIYKSKTYSHQGEHPTIVLSDIPLKVWLDNKIRVNGILFWVKGWKRPALEVYKLEFLP